MTKTDIYTLPSGLKIDLLDFNATACGTVDDCNAALSILQEKIIDIEYQIDCLGMGHHPDGSPITMERPPPPLWEPRAKKALSWAKLQKSEVAQQIARLSKARERADRERLQKDRERAFLEVARQKLTPSLFAEIMLVAVEMTDTASFKVESAA